MVCSYPSSLLFDTMGMNGPKFPDILFSACPNGHDLCISSVALAEEGYDAHDLRLIVANILDVLAVFTPNASSVDTWFNLT